MKKAAAELEFEQAAEYRDLIENVKRIGEKQKINDTGGDDRDIIAMAKAGDEAVVAIFLSEAASFSMMIFWYSKSRSSEVNLDNSPVGEWRFGSA